MRSIRESPRTDRLLPSEAAWQYPLIASSAKPASGRQD